jgi:hypothetical protein
MGCYLSIEKEITRTKKPEIMKHIYLTLLMFVTAVAGAQIVSIPDANFKARLVWNGYDTNTDNEIQVSEAQAVTGTVNLNQSFFTDMTGIEAFTNIEAVYCEQNSNITAISLANMPNIKSLHIGENLNLQTLQLTNMSGLDTLKCNSDKLMGALDLAGAPSLKYLHCNSNFITSLNVSNCTQLKYLFYGSNQVPFANLQLPPGNTIEQVDCGNNGLVTYDQAVFPFVKVLNCGSNPMPSLTINSLPLLERLFCGNSQMTSLSIAVGTPLIELNCSGNFLTTLDISVFPTLEKFQADGNHFTSLTFGSLPNLEWVSCAAGTLPAINVSGCPNLEYLNCHTNEFTTIDLSNLINLKQAYCGTSVLASINISNTPALEILDVTGGLLTNLDLTGHANLTQLHCGGNQLATLDLTPCPFMYALNCWQNNLTSLDVSGCSNLWALSCSDNQLTTLDCNNNTNLTFLDIYANPIETLFIKNGHQEYFNDPGNFVENPNLVYICADEAEIPYLQSKPGMNASVNTYCSFTPANDYNTVTGTVRFDAGNDGCSPTDFAMPFMRINTADSQDAGATFTSNNGTYHYYTNDMFAYLQPSFENPSYFNAIPQANITFPGMNSIVTQDFCITANGVHQDLEIVIAPVIPARPGFEAVYKIVIHNKGNQVMSMPFGYSFHYNADLMSFVQATTTPASQGPGLIIWDYANLQPFETRSVEVVMQINAPTHPTHPVNVNDQLVFTAVIEAVGGDEMPDDNAFVFNQTVIGSYDPNNLICIEGDIQPVEQIGEYLHYIANFENTGTDAAVNIVVKTVFDPTQVDVNSLRILDASHPTEIRVNGNTAEYIFQDINLAIGGHGNILLKIKSDDTLVDGDSVLNRADIFFDYNLPVATNDAETTFQLLSIDPHEQDASIVVYPNPTNGQLNVSASTNIQSLQLFDIQGRLLQTALRNETSVSIDISAKQSGIYFVKVISDKGTSIQKIVKK